MPSSHESGNRPVSRTILKKDTYVGNKMFAVDFIYSFIMRSFDGLLFL